MPCTEKATASTLLSHHFLVAAYATEMAAQQPKSRAYYRVAATRKITAGKEVDASPVPEPPKVGKMSRAKVAAEADAVAEAEAQSDEECEIENIVDVK